MSRATVKPGYATSQFVATTSIEIHTASSGYQRSSASKKANGRVGHPRPIRVTELNVGPTRKSYMTLVCRGLLFMSFYAGSI